MVYSIVGIGILTMDYVHFYDNELKRNRFLFNEGGGSVWNQLVNCTKMDLPVFGFYLSNKSTLVDEISNNLKQEGIKLMGDENNKSLKVRKIHQIIYGDFQNAITYNHKFQIKCPYCKNKAIPRIQFTKGTILESKIKTFSKKIESQRIILFDQINKPIMGILKMLKTKKSLTVLDLSYTGQFRWLKKDKILEKFQDIDIAFMTETVYTSLLKKLDSNDPKLIFKKTPLKMIFVTKNDKGVSVYVKSQDIVEEFVQPVPEAYCEIDSAGAGDAFIAKFIEQLSKNDNLDSFFEVNNLQKKLEKAQKYAGNTVQYIGARGHIYSTTSEKKTLENMLKIYNKRKINYDLSRNQKLCPVCHEEIRKEVSKEKYNYNPYQKYIQNLHNFDKRVFSLLKLTNLDNWETLEAINTPFITVGTGGTFIPAVFFSLILGQRNTVLGKAMKPFDYLRMGIKTETIILFTYSGKTPDILSVIKKAKKLEVKRMIVITANKTEKLVRNIRRKDIILLMNHKSKERGFIPVSGSILPCVALWLYYKKVSSSLNLREAFKSFRRESENKLLTSISNGNCMEKVRNALVRRNKICLLGGGNAWPAIYDIENKLREGKVDFVQKFEIKDFSHGKFMSCIDEETLFIIMGLCDDKEYRNLLITQLKKMNFDVLHISSNMGGIDGMLDLLIQASYLTKIMFEKSTDCQFKIPKKLLLLYKYDKLQVE